MAQQPRFYFPGPDDAFKYWTSYRTEAAEKLFSIMKLSGADISVLEEKFKQHIHDNENVFHLDKAGQFVKLWPELGALC